MSMFGASKPGGMFGGLSNYSDTMIIGGLGMLSGQNPQQQFAGAMQGYGAGSQMDTARREKAEKDKLEADRKAAFDALVADPEGPMKGLSPAWAQLMGVNQDLALPTLLEQKLKPKLPDYGFTEVGDVVVRTDSTAGTAEPVYQSPNAGKPDAASVANITTIRKEVENQPGTSRFRTAAPILESMMGAVDDPTAMADLDFIYGMAKIFDPGSVVRETEMGMVIDSQSMPATIKGQLEKLLNGEAVLQPQTRRDLVNASVRRVGEYRKQAENESAFYKQLAADSQIAEEQIVRPLEPLPAWPEQPVVPGAPAVPTVPPVGEQTVFDNAATIPEGAIVEENGLYYKKQGGQLIQVPAPVQ